MKCSQVDRRTKSVYERGRHWSFMSSDLILFFNLQYEDYQWDRESWQYYIIHDKRTLSLPPRHIRGLSSQLFIGQYLIRYDILTWFSMISVFVLLNWRELKSVENSLCLTVSSTQWSVKRLPWSILEILHNSHVSRTEKWNNFYLVFSVCFWFPRSFHFYFWESEETDML